MSRRQIAEYLGVPRSTCLDYLRAYYSALAEERVDEMYYEAPVKDKHDNSRILFISDMHIPYHHEDLIPFLLMLKDRYRPTRVICLGDELDKHALSFHASDPDLKSAGDELAAALPIIAEIHNIFPKMDLIDSNHGSMVYRKAKEHGIPRRYIRSYNEVLGVGDGWVWHNDLTIELPDGQQVYVHHGKSADAIKTSQAMSMSHVCGHFHESFGVKYWANPNGLFWAMNAGCLIDDKSLAFQYNNVNLKRPIIGTGLIIDGVPVLEAMQL
jgi:predicted phosphodiesterase